MPKVVDVEERRKRLVEAVWALAVRGGVEQVTLRKVADEAGVSMGQVQHYYSSMQALVADSLDRAVHAVNTAIEKAVEAAGTASPEVVLRTCLHALVGADEDSVRLMRFSLAVAGRAASDPAMAKVLAPGDEALLAFTAELIGAARRERGSGARGDDRIDEDHIDEDSVNEHSVDDDHIEADICWSLAVSLGVDVALGHRTPEAAGRVLDYHVDQILGGRSRS
ncbi:MAG: TetR family transcriptional regulator [Catenulispora sp.]|nr:TetR family transcriptional regulator [Catenulispora sp.]